MDIREIDEQFAELIAWLQARNLEAVTRRSQTLLIYAKRRKVSLEVRDGKLKRKEKK